MKRLLHVVSFTTELDASRQFYRDAMGLRPGADTPFMVNFSTDGAGLMLLAVQPTQRREVELCFESERVGTVVETLRNRGVEFIDELRHLAFGSVIHFRDPEGNLLSLLQPGSGAATSAAERKAHAAAKRGGAAEAEQTSLALADFVPPAHTGPALTTAIVRARDMAAARAYYGRSLSLKESVQSPMWVQYDTGEVQLAIHCDRDRGAPDRSMAQPVSLGFSVEDLDEWKHAASARGVNFSNVQAGLGLGAAAEMSDPEGNIIFVRERVSEAQLQRRLDAASATKRSNKSKRPAVAERPTATKREVKETAVTKRPSAKAAAPKRASAKTATTRKPKAPPKPTAPRKSTKRLKPRDRA